MKRFLSGWRWIAAVLCGAVISFSPAADQSLVRFTYSAAQAHASGTPTLSLGNEQPIVQATTNSPVRIGGIPSLSSKVVPSNTPAGIGGFGDSASADSYQIPTNSILEFPVPLSQAAQMSLWNGNLGRFDSARAGIAVPPGFNPTNIYPLLIVCATSDGDASSVRAMRSYTNVALQMGFVVVAADGPYGRPTNDTPVFRFAMLTSVLEHLHRSWPTSRAWPMVCAGFSGGGKWSGVIGAGLNSRGYKVIGVFQGGVNQDFTSEAAKMYSPALRYRATPFYLSSGTEDKIATPLQHEEVRRSLLTTGFSMVRVETHEGGHNLDPGNLEKALAWFLQLNRLQTAHAQAASSNANTRSTNVSPNRSTNRIRAVSVRTNSISIRDTKAAPLK